MTKTCDGASVGVLLLDRHGRLLTFTRPDGTGIACVAGHVYDEHENPEDAARAEVHEETGLEVVALGKVSGGFRKNKCKRGNGPDGVGHYWDIYLAAWTGVPNPSIRETEDVRWRRPAELQELAEVTVSHARGLYSPQEWADKPGLEPVWVQWLWDADLISISLQDLHDVEQLAERGIEALI